MPTIMKTIEYRCAPSLRLWMVIVLVCVGYTLQAKTLAERGDSAYAKEDYRTAASLYEQSLAQEGPSASVYYNLGNAKYRRGDLSGAILGYERALRLNPTYGDARANLAFVNGKIQDRPEDDRSFLSRAYDGLVTSAQADTWAWIAFGSFVLLLGGVALYVFTGNVMWRKTGFFGAIVMFFVCIVLSLVAWDATRNADDHHIAIVTAPTTYLTSAPRAPKAKTDKVVEIHEGTRVEITDSVPTPEDVVSPMYYQVRINQGTRAWLRATDVERI